MCCCCDVWLQATCPGVGLVVALVVTRFKTPPGVESVDPVALDDAGWAGEL